MCLGIPGRIVEIIDEDLTLAKAEVSGVRRNINIGLVHYDEERVEIGDWVLIHVGFALSKIDEDEARATLKALEDVGESYEQELEELRTVADDARHEDLFDLFRFGSVAVVEGDDDLSPAGIDQFRVHLVFTPFQRQSHAAAGRHVLWLAIHEQAGRDFRRDRL